VSSNVQLKGTMRRNKQINNMNNYRNMQNAKSDLDSSPESVQEVKSSEILKIEKKNDTANQSFNVKKYVDSVLKQTTSKFEKIIVSAITEAAEKFQEIVNKNNKVAEQNLKQATKKLEELVQSNNQDLTNTVNDKINLVVDLIT